MSKDKEKKDKEIIDNVNALSTKLDGIEKTIKDNKDKATKDKDDKITTLEK